MHLAFTRKNKLLKTELLTEGGQMLVVDKRSAYHLKEKKYFTTMLKRMKDSLSFT